MTKDLLQVPNHFWLQKSARESRNENFKQLKEEIRKSFSFNHDRIYINYAQNFIFSEGHPWEYI